ncbi:hypothetical protein DCAR_0935108 [Daucus carota subsp. sativus]|uniref:Anaphase-promoting complex subunit 4 WD40 domain-containing protein n=1 Tax=Daucus carota subsp. sativus TaxID=79200 RepID=A0AAF0XWH8_DAUCS|nr:hypothetical protein DCAR_0935108 [Daucus carota subsp. sativus]
MVYNKVYGVPLYGSSWLPLNLINSADDHDHDHDHGSPSKSQHDDDINDNDPLTKPQHDHDDDPLIKSQHDNNDDPQTKSHHDHTNSRDDRDHDDVAVEESPPSIKPTRHVVLSGGGGEGRIGIPNALLISQFDPNTKSLSDHPVAELGTGADLPSRMAVHPKGEGVMCSMPKSCRWYEWEAIERDGVHGWSPKSSEKIFKQLEDVGRQLALTFNEEGSVLATGGEDGKLRVFKWPTMDSILDESGAHASVKDLAFSPDGRFLASVGSSGPGRVWDIASSAPIASLKTKKDEQFVLCKFSQSLDNNHQILYVTAMQGKGGSIVKWKAKSWKPKSWKRISSKLVTRDSITAFSVSADGKYLAVGTMEGDILVLNSSSMLVHSVIKKAHLGILTSLMFSEDSRALLSTSFDSSARVTLIDDEKMVTIINDQKIKGWNFWIILFILFLAIAVYYVRLLEFLVLLEDM